MPYSLSPRQKSYLKYLKNYISNNNSSPSLKHIADHFEVKSSTAHNILEALHKKGYIYLHRPHQSGFFIRLIDKAGKAEINTEINILGRFNSHGEVYDYPKLLGHFPYVISGIKTDQFFSLIADEDIPQVGILEGDLLIFNKSKKPQIYDLCLYPLGKRWFLLHIDKIIITQNTKSFKAITPGVIIENENYAIKRFNWVALEKSAYANSYLLDFAERMKVEIRLLSLDKVEATADFLRRQIPNNS
jgi:SOS-response transcriptional repressor LexA